MVNEIVSVISLTDRLLSVYRNATDLFFNFSSCSFTEFTDELQQFSGGIFRIF